MWDWFYNLPTGGAFLLFVISFTLISLLGLYIYKLVDFSSINCKGHNDIIGIFITIISVFLGVMLTFIIVEVWNDYDRARLDATKEAGTIFILYQSIRGLANTEQIQELIIDYLEYIIEVEYPAMRERVVPPEGNELMEELQVEIYSYIPKGDQQLTLYSNSIQLLNVASSYRVDRIDSGTVGVNSLVWWITFIDSIMLVIISWFLVCSTLSHYILTATIAIYVASAIFLTLILSYPFRGYSALLPIPFQNALDTILSGDVRA